MESWIAENDGGDTLNSFVYLVDALKGTTNRLQEVDNMYNHQRNLMGQYFTERDTMDDWNEWLQEQENKNAVQKQQTEEVPLQEEAESGKEAVKAPKKAKK